MGITDSFTALTQSLTALTALTQSLTHLEGVAVPYGCSTTLSPRRSEELNEMVSVVASSEQPDRVGPVDALTPP